MYTNSVLIELLDRLYDLAEFEYSIAEFAAEERASFYFDTGDAYGPTPGANRQAAIARRYRSRHEDVLNRKFPVQGPPAPPVPVFDPWGPDDAPF